MSASICIVSLCLISAEGELAARLQHRDEVLNRTTVEYLHSVYISPRTASPFDLTAWRETPGTRRFRITVSRPNVLLQSLDDLPQQGYAAVDYSICGDRYLARWTRPDREGRTVYMYSPDSTREGVFLWSAALEVFELRLAAFPDDHASLRTPLEEGRLEILGTDGGLVSCRWEGTLEDGSHCVQMVQLRRYWFCATSINGYLPGGLIAGADHKRLAGAGNTGILRCYHRHGYCRDC